MIRTGGGGGDRACGLWMSRRPECVGLALGCLATVWCHDSTSQQARIWSRSLATALSSLDRQTVAGIIMIPALVVASTMGRATIYSGTTPPGSVPHHYFFRNSTRRTLYGSLVILQSHPSWFHILWSTCSRICIRPSHTAWDS
jgi:hypothetical protein